MNDEIALSDYAALIRPTVYGNMDSWALEIRRGIDVPWALEIGRGIDPQSSLRDSK